MSPCCLGCYLAYINAEFTKKFEINYFCPNNVMLIVSLWIGSLLSNIYVSPSGEQYL